MIEQGITSGNKLEEMRRGFEVHHIQPKCIFKMRNQDGVNNFSNLVLMTHEEHVYAHYLLMMAQAQHHKLNELDRVGYCNNEVWMILRNPLFKKVRLNVRLGNQDVSMTARDAVKCRCIQKNCDYRSQKQCAKAFREILRMCGVKKHNFSFDFRTASQVCRKNKRLIGSK